MNGVNAKTVEVLVTGGHVRSALCVARSLARRGVLLMVIGEAPVMALRSR
jgi:UDP-N-acetylglucosamine:LPS N-acetylglucosamine transferase